MNSLSRRSAVALLGMAFLPARLAWAEDSGDDVHAPFGLKWGCSAEDLRKRGCRLTPRPDIYRYGVTYQANTVPKQPNDARYLYAAFGNNDKLWCVALLSDYYLNDLSGREVLRRYSDLSSSLTGVYGAGKEIYQMTADAGTKPFITAISNGKIVRFTNFETDSVEVKLSVDAGNKLDSFYSLIYTYKPGKKEFEDSNKDREKGAL